MAELKVTVRNKIAIGDGSVIVCDNTDYAVKFDLDSEWSGLTNRTMIVAFSDHTMASPVLFTGDTANLPQVQGHEIAYIGLKAGNLHTTTAAAFQCARSISTIGGTITPPSTEVWNQIIAKLDEIEDELEDKQDTLTAGTGISIVDNVISATGSASVTRSAIETALGSDSPNLSANDYSNTEKASVTANTAARHTHDNKTVLDTITSGKTSAWDAKSTVSVSASGTATDEVQYITIDGVEKKLAGGGGGGTSDFDELTNRPKYNGSAMTHATNIPEVKTAAWDGKYAKPADGIPSTDMASAVQTSLGKADSALQSVKTINNQSITGTGNLNVPMGGDIIQDEDESNCGVVVSGTLANVDATLSISGAAADAAVTGDEIEILKRKYVLFETITLAEDMASITRTTDDSTFFDCSRLYVGIATAAGSANDAIKVVASYNNNTISEFKHDDAIKTSAARYMHCEFMNECGIWGARGVNGAAGEGYKVAVQLQVRSTPRTDTNMPYINKLVITSGTEGVLIPANTVINIYGVKV